MSRRRLVLALAVLPAIVPAQVDSQAWIGVAANVRRGDWRFFGELQPRIGEDDVRARQFIARAAVGRQLTREFSLWAGYGWTPTVQPTYFSEDRYFLQALWETRTGVVSIANRTRLEARNIEGTFGTSVRLRHQIRGTVPLGVGTPWTAFASNEVFYNVNSTPAGPKAGFDQDRLSFGLGYRLNPGARLEGAYQAVIAGRPTPVRRADVLVVTLALTF